MSDCITQSPTPQFSKLRLPASSRPPHAPIMTPSSFLMSPSCPHPQTSAKSFHDHSLTLLKLISILSRPFLNHHHTCKHHVRPFLTVPAQHLLGLPHDILPFLVTFLGLYLTSCRSCATPFRPLMTSFAPYPRLPYVYSLNSPLHSAHGTSF